VQDEFAISEFSSSDVGAIEGLGVVEASDDAPQLLEFDPPSEPIEPLIDDVTPTALPLGEPIVDPVTSAAEGGAHVGDDSQRDVSRETIDTCKLPIVCTTTSDIADVWPLQAWLRKQGWLRVSVEPGVYDRATMRAVQKLQRFGDGYGGPIDGMWNEATRAFACARWDGV